MEFFDNIGTGIGVGMAGTSAVPSNARSAIAHDGK